MNFRRWFDRAVFLWCLVALLLALQGCSNQYEEAAREAYSSTERRLLELGEKIDSGKLPNTLVIASYAGKLPQLKPEFTELAELLGQEASTRGDRYLGLIARLKAIDQEPDNKQQFVPVFQEFEALQAAADPLIYNDSLLDVVNTLADLSEGKLPRINVPKAAETAVVDGGGAVAGSYLVGNPAYGRWAEGSSGSSIWEWYGKYALFRTLFGGFGGGYYHSGPIYHDSWYKRDRYSYHHDYGRSTYGTRSDRNRWEQGRKRLESRGIKTPKPKNYGSTAGQKRVSTYASMRQKNSAALRSGKLSSTSGKAVKRSSSFFGGSTRGTSSGARGGFGGK